MKHFTEMCILQEFIDEYKIVYHGLKCKKFRKLLYIFTSFCFALFRNNYIFLKQIVGVIHYKNKKG